MIQSIPKVSDERFIIGHSDRRNLVLVSFVEADETVRLISARKATGTERESYEEDAKS